MERFGRSLNTWINSDNQHTLYFVGKMWKVSSRFYVQRDKEEIAKRFAPAAQLFHRREKEGMKMRRRNDLRGNEARIGETVHRYRLNERNIYKIITRSPSAPGYSPRL